MVIGWMIFGENGKWQASTNMPYQLTKMLQNNQTQGNWVINRVFFAPDSDSYVVTDNVSNPVAFQEFPQDALSGIYSLISQGRKFYHFSWVSKGQWAALGASGAPPYSVQLGSAAPSALSTALSNWAQASGPNGDGRIRYSPSSVTFAPSGDWCLVGFDEGDEGSSTCTISPNFPADLVAAANNLPEHVGVRSMSLNPGGGWVMVDTNGNFHNSNAPTDLVQAIGVFKNSGNVLTDVTLVALKQPEFPIQATYPNDGSFQVLQGGKGAAMQTSVTIQSNGSLSAMTEIRTSNDLVGATGGVMVALMDYTGQLLWNSDVQQFGVDGKDIGSSDNKNNWTASVPTNLLPTARVIQILQTYDPKDLGIIFTTWMNALSNPVGQVIKAITS
jgi:hypothetical protein